MPKDVMEKLGLEVTRPYKDLHSFDSSKVGLIKYLCITLAQISAKSRELQTLTGYPREISLKESRYALCHHPGIWTTEKTVHRNPDEV
jgi:hypothetical protein